MSPEDDRKVGRERGLEFTCLDPLTAMAQRQHPRFQTQLSIAFSGHNVAGSGQVTDLALGGCAVESSIAVPTGIPLALRVLLPEGGDPLEVDMAVVRWVEVGKCGLEFLIMPGESQQRLRLFLGNL